MTDVQMLYIDDSLEHLDAVKRSFAQHGVRVKTCTSAAEAAMCATLERFDLVLIDYFMPRANGAEALAELKQAKVVGAPLYYLYTSDTKTHTQARAMGFEGAFIMKGDAASLLRQMEPVLRRLRLKRMAG